MTWSCAIFQLPFRREHVSTCEHCGRSVLAFACDESPRCVVDPDPYQRLIANLLVPPAQRASLPPWCQTPGYPLPHSCAAAAVPQPVDRGGEEHP